MFDRDNDNIIIKKIKPTKYYKYNNILITPTGLNVINEHHISKYLQEQMDYQDRITSYINRKHELNIKKNYNPIIVNLYENGLLVINKIEYKLTDFFIVFNNNDFNIKCIDEKYNNNKSDYSKAVKFIDTTAFINLINSEKSIIKDNRIIIDNQDTLNDIVYKWDGYLHNETKETEAIINKKMTVGDINA